MLFRISVVFFDINYKGGNLNEVKNYKKLLSLLSRIELTQGFATFIGQLRQSKASKIAGTSLTPPK